MRYLTTAVLFFLVQALVLGLAGWADTGDLAMALLLTVGLVGGSGLVRGYLIRREGGTYREVAAHGAVALAGVLLGAFVGGLVFESLRAGGERGLATLSAGLVAMGYLLVVSFLPTVAGFGLGAGWATIQMRDDAG